MTDHLPIYRLESEDASVARLLDMGQRIFDLSDDFKLTESRDSHVLWNGTHVVEVAAASGGVWAANESQLWKPSVRPELPKDEDALAKANELLRQRKLLPGLAKPFQFGKPIVGGTHYALRNGTKRENRRLDAQIIYPILVGDIPIVGGGGDFTVTFGHQASVIGFSGTWRPVKGSFEAKLIPRKQANEQFRAMTKSMKLESFDASLAYYAAPSFRAQEFLYPVYVYRAVAQYGKQRVPLRQIMLPASDFGPPAVFEKRQPPRSKSLQPRIIDRAQLPRRNLYTMAVVNPFEAGTSWIGESGGLSGSKANAQGFVDEWAAAGWHIDFNWGDGNAWESDWRRNNASWVDNADFVFYTGHANMNGWVLSAPDDTFLDCAEVGAAPGNPGELWGNNDLEWIVVAACGPLQDDVISHGGGDVLARWDGAFDGMHILMGYGAVTFDNTDEGRKVAQYAKGGSTLINIGFERPTKFSQQRTELRRRTVQPFGSAPCGSARTEPIRQMTTRGVMDRYPTIQSRQAGTPQCGQPVDSRER